MESSDLIEVLNEEDGEVEAITRLMEEGVEVVSEMDHQVNLNILVIFDIWGVGIIQNVYNQISIEL